MSRIRPDSDELSSTEPQPALSTCDTLDAVHERRGLLLRLAYRFCWNETDAEDAVQNAMLLATAKERQLDDRRKLWPWVRSIVVRQAQELLRKALRRRDIEHSAETPMAGGDDDTFSRNELGGMVKELIKRLPERQQTALILRHLEDMSYAEIAEMMRITESTARVHVRNGREALRAAVEARTQDRASEAAV